MIQPFGKAVRLHLQNKLTAFGAALGVAGHKGRGIDPAGQHGLRRLQIELHGLVALTGRLKAGIAGTLGFHALAVDFGLGTAAVKGGVLREDGAVLGNKVMSGKHHVLRALTVPGGSIKVAAQQAGRLVGHQRPAVLGLANGLIAGGKICDHGRTGQRMEGGGRQGAPQILADLHTQHKAGHLAAAEQQGGAKGHLLTAHLRQLHIGAARGELPLFVELAIVGQIGLGHKAQDPAMAQHGGAVVQLAVHQQRQADQSHHVQLLRFSQQGAQSVQRAGLQSTLQKQVAAGIAGQAELGEHGQLHAAGCGFAQSLGDLPDVIGAVGHPQCGRKGGCFQKTIFHRRFSHPVFLS